MKKCLLTCLPLLLVGASLVSQAQTATRYVSDVIYIPLRSDKTPQAGVLKNGLGSGTRLQLLKEETGSDNNLWSQVITPDGIQGWVRSQNLTDKPTAAMQLAALSSGTRDLVVLQSENTDLKQQLEKIQQSYQQLLADTEDMRQAATTALNLEEESQRIHAEYQLLQTRVDVLNAENEQLRDADRYSQWLNGGILVVGGVLLSFLLQALGRRKRRSEWG